MKILHIAPHYGGGTKTVILNWLQNDKENNHTLVSLGYADNDVQQVCYENKIVLYSNFENRNYDIILDQIKDQDIVLIHYWNFPLLMDFISNTILSECRLIVWCHMSGLYPPYTIPKQLIDYSDKFIFTSPISYNGSIFKDEFINMKKIDTIWSTGGTKYKDVIKKEHEGFNILYVGTLDFSKLREDFIYTCKEILNEIPEAYITVCGTGCDKDFLVRQVEGFGLQNKIIFEGMVSDLISYFETSDIFLYPMQKKSFSTCEQVLGEAMSAGVVPIVYDNLSEREIIQHMYSGFIAEDTDEYIDGVKYLYHHKNLINELSKNAKRCAIEKYNTSKMINDWNKQFSEIISLPKKEKYWYSILPGMSKQGISVFLDSLGSDYHIFYNYIIAKEHLQDLFVSNKQWYSKSKASVYQYLTYFPEDQWLNEFKKLMEE